MKTRLAVNILIALFSPLAVVAILIASINLYMIAYAKPFIKNDIDEIPHNYCTIVPGAKAYTNSISHAFRDRISAGMELFYANKTNKLLISGDHGRKSYDEVNAAYNYIKKMYNIDETLIFLDHAGFSTYETMYRAKAVFCVTEATIVTQKFHLYRSIYIAKKLGINVYGYVAKPIMPFTRKTMLYWKVREILARVKNFFLVLKRPRPTFLGEQIPITGSATITHDE